jgi:hypothetical protein
MIPSKVQGIHSVNYSDMSLKELRDKLADAEEQMVKANPQMHSDAMWSKWMRERIANINSAIKNKISTKNVNEHYVDTEWSRQGLEPEFPEDKYPVMYSQPHMQMVGTPMRGAPNQLVEAKDDRTIVFTKKVNPSFQITIKVGRDGRISEIENERHIRFPYSIGQPYNRGLETWACNNGFLMDGKDMCPEKKIFGIKVSDIPQGHEWRHIFPGKFR